MTDADRTPAPRYAWYGLSVLFLVYVLNFVDRQIPAILAEDIKHSLHLRDQDLGFLYGTAFGVFYALFGIPLGRLADGWHRIRLMTVGLALWSAMTAASGLARTGGALAAARIGVGVGEATAGPAAYSLLSDWFPRRLRATALAIYSAGIYVGGGLSLGLGGLVVERWNRAYPAGGPFGLQGWQAAFLVVGLPGLLMALWVATLREPVRGASEGIASEAHDRPFHAFLDELLQVLPPLTLIGAARRGPAAVVRNLLLALLDRRCGGAADRARRAGGAMDRDRGRRLCGRLLGDGAARARSRHLRAHRRQPRVRGGGGRLRPQRLPRLCHRRLGRDLRAPHLRRVAGGGGAVDRRAGDGGRLRRHHAGRPHRRCLAQPPSRRAADGGAVRRDRAAAQLRARLHHRQPVDLLRQPVRDFACSPPARSARRRRRRRIWCCPACAAPPPRSSTSAPR